MGRKILVFLLFIFMPIYAWAADVTSCPYLNENISNDTQKQTECNNTKGCHYDSSSTNNPLHYCIPCDQTHYGQKCLSECGTDDDTTGYNYAHQYGDTNNDGFQPTRGARTKFECYKEVQCKKSDLTDSTESSDNTPSECREYYRDGQNSTPYYFISCNVNNVFDSGTDTSDGSPKTSTQLYGEEDYCGSHGCNYHKEPSNGLCWTNEILTSALQEHINVGSLSLTQDEISDFSCHLNSSTTTTTPVWNYEIDSNPTSSHWVEMWCDFSVTSQQNVSEKHCTIEMSANYKGHINLNTIDTLPVDYFESVNWEIGDTNAGRTYKCINCLGTGYYAALRSANDSTTWDNTYGECVDTNYTNNHIWCSCELVPRGYYHHLGNGVCTDYDTCNPSNKKPCPAGMTSLAGSTSKDACHYTNQTQFCDAKGCFRLNDIGTYTNNHSFNSGWEFPNSYR